MEPIFGFKSNLFGRCMVLRKRVIQIAEQALAVNWFREIAKHMKTHGIIQIFHKRGYNKIRIFG